MSKKKRIFPVIVTSFQERTDDRPTEMIVHDELPSSTAQFENIATDARGYYIGKIYSSGKVKTPSIGNIKEQTEFCVYSKGENGEDEGFVHLEAFIPLKTDFGTTLYRWFPNSKGPSYVLFRIPAEGVEKYAILDSFGYDQDIPKVSEIKHLTDKVICFHTIYEKKHTRYVFYNTYNGETTTITIYNELNVIMSDEGSRIRIVKRDDLGTQRGFIIDKDSAEQLRKYFPESERNLNMYN